MFVLSIDGMGLISTVHNILQILEIDVHHILHTTLHLRSLIPNNLHHAYHHPPSIQVHTLQLTSKKLEAYRRETEQLFYSMSGAEIFFKRTDVDT